mmetsp:Transcript_54488/g.151877  ORF Transcript_54488/g.151877 Transcript_54488/m.151877 type:complete len:244 (+) Transcript_54488:856-1587(+)
MTPLIAFRENVQSTAFMLLPRLRRKPSPWQPVTKQRSSSMSPKPLPVIPTPGASATLVRSSRADAPPETPIPPPRNKQSTNSQKAPSPTSTNIASGSRRGECNARKRNRTLVSTPVTTKRGHWSRGGSGARATASMRKLFEIGTSSTSHIPTHGTCNAGRPARNDAATSSRKPAEPSAMHLSMTTPASFFCALHVLASCKVPPRNLRPCPRMPTPPRSAPCRPRPRPLPRRRARTEVPRPENG